MAEVSEFLINVPDADLEYLRTRLRDTRWPLASPSAGWRRGVPNDYLKRIAAYWRDAYEWRLWEATLNAFPQFITQIDEQAIHFIHVRSPEPSALPLILTHGWPGSVVEFMNIIGPLSNPRAHGGDRNDAFHVVAPSVPGFGFSTPLASTGWNHQRIAKAWAELMTRLGYHRYGAHGSDTGSIVSPLLARVAPDRVVAAHISGGLEFADALSADFDSLTDSERRRILAVEQLRLEGTGYAAIQSTRPQTLAYALSDSPIGQLAWIVDKFHDWTDPAKELPEDAVDIDQLLTNVSFHWFTNSAGSSAELYLEVRLEALSTLQASKVPVGVAIFPTDPAVRSVVERHHNVIHWSEFKRGGHFAAMEAPDLLVDDIRTFFRSVR